MFMCLLQLPFLSVPNISLNDFCVHHRRQDVHSSEFFPPLDRKHHEGYETGRAGGQREAEEEKKMKPKVVIP